MKHKTLLSIIVTMFLFFLVSGCKKSSTGSNGPTGPQGPVGSISVTINLKDEFTDPLAQTGGATVTVSGGGQVLSKSTDANGNANFDNLQYETYTVRAQKPGFETWSGNYTLSNSTQAWSITNEIAQIPTVIIDSLEVSVNTQLHTVSVDGKFPAPTPAGKNRDFVLFFAANSTVSHLPSLHQYSISFGAGNSATFETLSLTGALTFNGGFTSGSTIYTTARVASNLFGDTDKVTGRFVYTAIETLSTVTKSFVLP